MDEIIVFVVLDTLAWMVFCGLFYITGFVRVFKKCEDLDDKLIDEYIQNKKVELNKMIDEKKLMEEIESFSMMITGIRSRKGLLADFMREYKKSILRIIDEYPRINEWIPCSEQLPEENHGIYYPSTHVTLNDWNVGWGFYRVRDKEWYVYNDFAEQWELVDSECVIAWQPLPEPYRPEEDER